MLCDVFLRRVDLPGQAGDLAAVERAVLLLDAPAATDVPASEELRRVAPVIEAIRSAIPSALISVDTVKSEVAREALEAGASIVNDVSGFRLDPRMAAVCAEGGAGAILMHSRGGVATMGTYRDADYGPDVVGEVVGELEERIVSNLDQILRLVQEDKLRQQPKSTTARRARA